MNKPLLLGGGRMLRVASAQRSIVLCQIGISSLPAIASVLDGEFNILGGRDTETVEKTVQPSARETGLPSYLSRGYLPSGGPGEELEPQ